MHYYHWYAVGLPVHWLLQTTRFFLSCQWFLNFCRFSSMYSLNYSTEMKSLNISKQEILMFRTIQEWQCLKIKDITEIDF